MRNPVTLNDKRNREKGNSYSKSHQGEQTKSEFVYCEKPDHRFSDYKTVETVTERRKILTVQGLNTGPQNALLLKLA